MPRPSLSTGKKTTARKTVADKISENTNQVVDTPKQYHQQFNNVLERVPGLEGINPNVIKDMTPQFVETAYGVSDPLDPPDNLPQATEAQFNKGMAIYAGADRALQLTGAAFDLSRQRFTVVGKQARAFGAGIKAATEFEKVRGDYFDYQNQIETNLQKTETLDVNRHRTGVVRTQSGYDKTSLDEKLNQSRIDAELNQAKSRSKQSALDEFLKQLGENVA